MLIFWKQSREIIVTLGMTGFFAALIYFGVVRILENNQGKMESIQQAMVDRKMLEEQSAGISNMRETWERIQAADGKLEVFLPKDHIVSLVESLESIGQELGVSVLSEASPTSLLAAPPAKKMLVKSVVPTSDEPASSEKTGEAPTKDILVSLLPEERSIFITFKVTGTYNHVLAFLQKLDTMPVLLDVLSVEISPAETVDDGQSVPVSVSGVSSSPFAVKSSSVSVASPQDVQVPPERPPEVQASFSTVIYTTP
ncbi:MAG: hypothetical protein WBC29_03355 [Candidatus Moraniibacteriota bacterium]